MLCELIYILVVGSMDGIIWWDVAHEKHANKRSIKSNAAAEAAQTFPERSRARRNLILNV